MYSRVAHNDLFAGVQKIATVNYFEFFLDFLFFELKILILFSVRLRMPKF